MTDPTTMPGAITSAPSGKSKKRPGRWGFLLRRLGFYLLTFWVALTLNFLLPRLMPGDPTAATIRQLELAAGGPLPPGVRETILEMFGDPRQNIWEQYVTYLVQLSHGDLGLSVLRYPMPVADLLAQALPWSLALIGVSTIIAWLLGVGSGVVLGWRQGSRLDSIVTPSMTIVSVVPDFWIAIVFLYAFAFSIPLFPAAGGYDPNVPYEFSLEFLVHALPYAALPIATLVVASFAGWVFQMRNMMVTTLGEEYTLLARAKGLRDRTIMFRYGARNALLPSVTALALQAPALITGAVFVETVFTYPGMGYYFTQAVARRDFPTMQAIFLLVILLTLVANFLADSLYAVLDPRTRKRS
jgi:peptide/nickel transport system permease protein